VSKLISLAVAGLASKVFSNEPISPVEIRGYPLDTAAHAVIRKEEKRRMPNRKTGTAAAKRAAKKKRNRK
jgi:hypothetical protein